MVSSWFLFPAVLTVLAVGCGLLVDRLAGGRLSRALIPIVGLAGLIVAGQLATLAAAELTSPLAVALAVAGFVAGRERIARGSPWPLAAAVAVFAIFAAPIVLSGEATFAGYIRLDDTATWMALTDRVMEHGRSLDGLAPSTYEATLDFNLADGYPIGVFLPLGIGAKLIGTDVAWLVDPYMAWLAALLALALWRLGRPLVAAPWLRAVAAAIAAQSALLFGYYLWGGIKEVAAAALVAGAAAAIAELVESRFATRALVPVAVIAAGLIGVLSLGGVIWIAPALAAAAVLAARSLPAPAVAGKAGLLVVFVVVLSVPVAASGLLPPTSSPLTDGGARGNLVGALEPAQVVGIWPAGDFRFDPDAELAAAMLIAATLLLAAGALALAWRRRAWAPLLYVGGTLVAAGAIWAVGSPWVEGKAMATASPAIPFAGALAGALAIGSGRRWLGGVAIAMLAVGVVWSNALAYRDANLAPRDQLAELERIGETIAGEGPTLMTEYQPYGARHFLREGDPESASELRRRLVPLASGGTLAKGEAADTDEIDPAALYLYRTLVLRRSPAQSRPPAPYGLAWRGAYYEVWQRPEGPAPEHPRLALGGEVQPVGRPSCAELRAFAAGGSRGEEMVAASRPPVLAVPLARTSYPGAWRVPGSPSHPVPNGSGTIVARVAIEDAGDYEVWLGGSVRPGVELRVDGRASGEVRHQLENLGQYVRLGEATLAAGEHTVEVRFGDADLHPGSGGAAAPVGPLVLSAADAADALSLIHI